MEPFFSPDLEIDSVRDCGGVGEGVGGGSGGGVDVVGGGDDKWK